MHLERLAIVRGDLTDFQLLSPPSHDRFQIYSYMAEFTNCTKVSFTNATPWMIGFVMGWFYVFDNLSSAKRTL